MLLGHRYHLRHHICKIIIGANFLQYYFTTLDNFLYEIKSNIDVLRSSVINLIFDQMNSILAIIIYIDIFLNYPQITYQTPKPQYFINCLCCYNVLCFRSRQCHYTVQHRPSANLTLTKCENIARGRSSLVKILNIVRISIPANNRPLGSLVHQPLILCSL